MSTSLYSPEVCLVEGKFIFVISLANVPDSHYRMLNSAVLVYEYWAITDVGLLAVHIITTFLDLVHHPVFN
jgi:hypothetical protein